MKRDKQNEKGKKWARMALACQGCAYHVEGKYCDYIGVVGRRRPCPPGKDCTVKKVTGRKQVIDQTLLAALYEEGLRDQEIAERARCSVAAVVRWRKGQGLPTNKKRSN